MFRRPPCSALAAVLPLLLALIPSAALAGPLTSASLTFVIGTLPPAGFPAVGASGSATSSLSASLGAGTAFNGTFSTLVTNSTILTEIEAQLTGNGAGAFAGATPSSVGGAAVFSGLVEVKGFGGAVLLGVPLQIGTPSTITKSASGIHVTAIFASWTAGTAAVTGLTGSASTVTLMGANGLGPSGQGTLVLVTPIKVLTNLVGTLPAFGILSLTYVPEPGTLLLLGAGVVALALRGRRAL